MAAPLFNEYSSVKVQDTKIMIVEDKPKLHFIIKLFLNGEEVN